MTPLSGRKIQFQLHDANSLQAHHSVAQSFTHPADLTVQTLHQNNFENSWRQAFHLARTRGCIQNMDPTRHRTKEGLIVRSVHSYDVFLFVAVTFAQNVIYDIAIVRHENEPFAHLIQPANREQPRWIINKIHNVVLLAALVRCANDANGLVDGEIHTLLLSILRHDLAPNSYDVARHHLRSLLRHLAIDFHCPCIDEFISNTTRAIPHLREILVNPDTFAVFHIAKIGHARNGPQPATFAKQQVDFNE